MRNARHSCHDVTVPARSTTTIPLAEPTLQPDRQPLDDVSKKIIEQLQQDGRPPYASIAASVGLSEAAVRQRVQRLVRTGVVQIVAVTNPLHLGFTRQAMIGSGRRTTSPGRRGHPALEDVAYEVITAGRSTCWARSSARTTTTCWTS